MRSARNAAKKPTTEESRVEDEQEEPLRRSTPRAREAAEVEHQGVLRGQQQRVEEREPGETMDEHAEAVRVDL